MNHTQSPQPPRCLGPLVWGISPSVEAHRLSQQGARFRPKLTLSPKPLLVPPCFCPYHPNPAGKEAALCISWPDHWPHLGVLVYFPSLDVETLRQRLPAEGRQVGLSPQFGYSCDELYAGKRLMEQRTHCAGQEKLKPK